MKVMLRAWRPAANGSPTVVGFADVALMDYRMQIPGCCVKKYEGGFYVLLPAIPHVRDGKFMRDRSGGLSYTPAISFIENEDYLNFSTAVVKAVRAAHPEAFA